jgi:YYY domain-containing protein
MFLWLHNSLASVASWWLIVTGLGWVAFPFVFRCMPLLPDRGFGASKFAALVLLAFFQGWIAYWFHLDASSLLGPYAAPLCAALLLIALSLPSLVREREFLGRFLRESWRTALLYEAVFAAAFLAYLWMRSFFPDATFDALGWYGAEKWVNLTYLTSLWREGAIPPTDPWLAGVPMNYYYFSHLVWASLTRLSGAAPQVGFNLALGTLFALLLTLSFSTGWALSERKRGGAWAVFLIALAGPLATWGQLHTLIKSLQNGGLAEAARAFNFWAPSDVLPHTRNEFPAFNWLLGDLHAHATGLLLLLLALCLIAQLQRTREVEAPTWRGLIWSQGSASLLLIVVMAAMWMTNSWDLAVLGLLGIAWIKTESFKSLDGPTAASQTVQGLLLWATAALVAVKFFAGFFTAYTRVPLDTIHNAALAKLPSVLSILGAVGVVGAKNHSPFVPWVSFWGLFGMAFVLLWMGRIRSTRLTTGFNHPLFAVVLVVLLLYAVGRHRGYASSPKAGLLCLLILAGCMAYAASALRSFRLTAPGQWILLLGTAALVCIIIPEFLYVDDPIGPPNQRYNTVFKLYYPAWALLSLALAVALSRHRPATASVKVVEANKAALEAGDWRPETGDWALETGTGNHRSGDWNWNLKDNETDRTSGTPISPPSRRSGLSTQDSALLLAALWLIGVGALYPLLGVPARMFCGQQRLDGWIAKGVPPATATTACRTLDGLAFLNLPQYTTDDLRLGLWMRENIPVGRADLAGSERSVPHSALPEGRWLAEATGDSYSFVGRIAAISGIPCVLGWEGHEVQWRGKDFSRSVLVDRRQALDYIYNSEDDDETVSLCRALGVRWVVVSNLEREKYPALDAAKFERIGRLARQFGDAALYEISTPDGASALDKPSSPAQ